MFTSVCSISRSAEMIFNHFGGPEAVVPVRCCSPHPAGICFHPGTRDGPLVQRYPEKDWGKSIEPAVKYKKWHEKHQSIQPNYDICGDFYNMWTSLWNPFQRISRWRRETAAGCSSQIAVLMFPNKFQEFWQGSLSPYTLVFVHNFYIAMEDHHFE